MCIRDRLASLQQLGCQCFQGYLFSMPLPATDFAELMELDVNTLISGTLACQPHIDC